MHIIWLHQLMLEKKGVSLSINTLLLLYIGTEEWNPVRVLQDHEGFRGEFHGRNYWSWRINTFGTFE